MTTIVQRLSRAEMNLSGVLRSGIAGFLGGVAAGATARLSMRVIALAGGQQPGFSIPGTFFILLVFGVIFGIPLGFLYALLPPHREENVWWKPVLISLGVFLFFIILAGIVGADAEELAIVPGAVAVAAFLPVPLTHALSYTLARGRMERGSFLEAKRAVEMPSFLLLVAALCWDFYALFRLADSQRTPPMPIFRWLLGVGVRASVILTLTELAILGLGLLLIALPVVHYWRKYQSGRDRGMTTLILEVIGAAFLATSLIG
jgi:hypothetical protein